MAKDRNNNKKNGSLSAGNLFGKLSKKREQDVFEDEEEFIEEGDALMDDSAIDVTSGGQSDDSDSDLDINELLRKYLPELENEDDSAEEEESVGVLSRIKKSASDEIYDEDDLNGNGIPDDDEKLIDALDSAFGTKPEKKAPRFNLFASKNKKMYPDDEIISEYDLEEDEYDEYDESEEEYYESQDEEYADEGLEFEEPEKKKKGFDFFGLFGKKRREEDEMAYLEEDSEEDMPDDYDESYEENDESYTEDGEQTASPVRAGSEENTADGSEDLETAAAAEMLEEGEEEYNLEEIDPDAEFDPTDINLMVAFGLDGEENHKSGKAKEFGDRLESHQIEHTKQVRLDRPEFVDKTQTPEIRKTFKKRELGLWIRLGLCAVFSILLLIFENITVFTNLFTGSPMQFGGAFDPAVYPVVYIMVSLQLMLLACVCAFDEIVYGFKCIFRGVPKAESMTSVMVVVGIIYSVILCRVCKAPNEPVMFNFAVALSALLTLIYAVYNNKREMMNFRVVANKKAKHIVRRLCDEESECEYKAFADNDDVCDVMKIETTGFIDGFFARLEKPDRTTNLFMTFAMGVSAVLAVIFGIIMGIKGGNASMVWRVIYGAFLIVAPMSIYITFSYPFYRANLVAKEYDSAIIGDASLDEYSNASIISFDDKNVFPSYSVKVQNIRIYNNARIDRVLYYAASAFAYAGGPLQDVFEVATKDMGNSSDVKIYDTEAGFLATQVDGVNIIFGSADALTQRGLEIPESALKDDVDLSDELSIMYMFRESKLVAKMYIKYVMDADIDLILKQFSGSGLYVCVRTYDPNIDERMIARKAGMKRMPLKIVRYASAEEVGAYEAKADSGLVTCGSPKSLLQVISYCGKVLHTKKTNIALSVLSVLIGVAILALLVLSNSIDSLTSLFIAIYQLIWLIPMVISSKMFIR
ncbi:MAG: hypothetical protein E7672_05155 [Ruminococcaceae bacterium]|nr:hypothetical protein [Oscillospiraceae bacterium]